MQQALSKVYTLKQEERAAHTRTLIQLGGLVVKSGLAETLDIEKGADLQQDTSQKESALAMLGVFVSVNERLKESAVSEKTAYAQKARAFLKEQEDTSQHVEGGQADESLN